MTWLALGDQCCQPTSTPHWQGCVVLAVPATAVLIWVFFVSFRAWESWEVDFATARNTVLACALLKLFKDTLLFLLIPWLPENQALLTLAYGLPVYMFQMSAASWVLQVWFRARREPLRIRFLQRDGRGPLRRCPLRHPVPVACLAVMVVCVCLDWLLGSVLDNGRRCVSCWVSALISLLLVVLVRRISLVDAELELTCGATLPIVRRLRGAIFVVATLYLLDVGLRAARDASGDDTLADCLELTKPFSAAISQLCWGNIAALWVFNLVPTTVFAWCFSAPPTRIHLQPTRYSFPNSNLVSAAPTEPTYDEDKIVVVDVSNRAAPLDARHTEKTSLVVFKDSVNHY
eukprot:TRINITY_DN2421_c0_g1_i1.p1 TRINITY_DN2421_c0_g1~~TRINITY_DN2421_c0_g1_i1.p1  ORF type:complete len:346 (+),score=22.09 TRINITY_DN2421_c0_g1_i1:65-1102(+)